MQTADRTLGYFLNGLYIVLCRGCQILRSIPMLSEFLLMYSYQDPVPHSA